MMVAKPLIISTGQIVSATVPDDDSPAWTPGTYAAGATVIYASRVYEALATTADLPDVAVTLDPPTWMDRGVINRLRPFDGRIGNSAIQIGEEMVYRLRLSEPFDTLALMGVSAEDVRVRVLTAGDVVEYSETRNLGTAEGLGADWYSYYFGSVETAATTVFTALPGDADLDLEIRLSGAEGSYLRLGEVLVGKSTWIGDLLWGHSYGIQDFSRRIRDPDFGDWTLIARNYSDTARFAVQIETEREYLIRRLLADLRVTPALWIGAAHRPGSVIYGVYEDFSVVIGGPVHSQCDLTLSSML